MRVVPYRRNVAVRGDDGRRWIVTAWEPCHRPWHNPPVPCLHSDPAFPDCPPGQTVRARGLLSFYEGPDVAPEMKRLSDALTLSRNELPELGGTP